MKQPTERTFSAGAAFRIYGTNLDLPRITRELGLKPDHEHRQGDPDPGGRPYHHDMWSLASPLEKNQELEEHLTWLAERLLPHKAYILSLSTTFKTDIYSYKNCYTEQASLLLSPNALRMFTELAMELQVSLIFLPDEASEREASA